MRGVLEMRVVLERGEAVVMGEGLTVALGVEVIPPPLPHKRVLQAAQAGEQVTLVHPEIRALLLLHFAFLFQVARVARVARGAHKELRAMRAVPGHLKILQMEMRPEGIAALPVEDMGIEAAAPMPTTPET
jgi:hypothetical protein